MFSDLLHYFLFETGSLTDHGARLVLLSPHLSHSTGVRLFTWTLTQVLTLTQQVLLPADPSVQLVSGV